MKKNILTLDDLNPAESHFKLSSLPDITLTLKPFSLLTRTWALAKYGAEGVNAIFQEQRMSELADIAFFMLKDKSVFNNNVEEFLGAILTPRDHVALATAVLGTVGISEPKMEEISKALKESRKDPKPKAPTQKKKSIGAKRSTK